VLDRVADGVFDLPIVPHRLREVLEDARHHLVVALDGATVVGFASGVHYVHPDKPPELFVNELGVAPDHRRAGIGTRLLRALLEAGRDCGCREAWVLTEEDNAAASRLYERLGTTGPAGRARMYTFAIDSMGGGEEETWR